MKPVRIGYFDAAGHPRVKIKVFGVSESLKADFEAMIDTGFTGFLSIPLIKALPLGLTLFGTATYTLADGSTQPKLITLGTIEIAGDQIAGAIALEPNGTNLLVGMDFLTRYNRVLITSKKNGIVLIDEDDFDSFVHPPQPPANNPPPAPPPPPPTAPNFPALPPPQSPP